MQAIWTQIINQKIWKKKSEKRNTDRNDTYFYNNLWIENQEDIKVEYYSTTGISHYLFFYVSKYKYMIT